MPNQYCKSFLKVNMSLVFGWYTFRLETQNYNDPFIQCCHTVNIINWLFRFWFCSRGFEKSFWQAALDCLSQYGSAVEIASPIPPSSPPCTEDKPHHLRLMHDNRAYANVNAWIVIMGNWSNFDLALFWYQYLCQSFPVMCMRLQNACVSIKHILWWTYVRTDLMNSIKLHSPKDSFIHFGYVILAILWALIAKVNTI